MGGRVSDALEIVAVSAYLLGGAAYLRLRGRLRPDVSLPLLALRSARVYVGWVLGRSSGALSPIRPGAGHSYHAPLPLFLPELSDELPLHLPEASDHNSRLVVLEDGRPLGPAHAPHVEIEQRGLGRFSHWRDQVVFSTSDNSDPRTNGRRYEFDIR